MEFVQDQNVMITNQVKNLTAVTQLPYVSLKAFTRQLSIEMAEFRFGQYYIFCGHGGVNLISPTDSMAFKVPGG